MKSTKIPTRDEIAQNDKWDLTSLYLEEADWETDLTLIPDLAKELLAYKGKLAESPETLRNALDTYCRLLMIIETTGSYAFLLTAGDAENAENQDKYGRYMMIATSADAEVSFFVPELQSIDEKLLDQWCQRPDFVDYKIYISKLSRLKPYILSEKEERILSLGAESATACQKSFSMLTNVDIQKILPHKYPMLLVDKVLELEESKKITAVKCVTANEPFFQGHFPGNPIMPGVLITESLAQTGAILLLTMPENKGKLGVFTGINNFKFRKQVVPGDQLVMHAEILRIKGTMGKILCRSFVDDQLAAEGEFMFALV